MVRVIVGTGSPIDRGTVVPARTSPRGLQPEGPAMDVLDGRYELLGLLGQGGMAQVHRARDRLLDREVAVKVLRQAADLDDAVAARHRFATEARLLAQLDHPGLVTLLDVGTSTGHPYFVMELVDGGTLAEHLTGTPLDAALVASVGAQLADALAHAHARGVVHRDVKPGNVLLAPDGRAKLADFGIARLLGETVSVTRTGSTVGTVAYLAPEQVRGEAVTPAVDVYALGLLLLEALTGARAYPGTSTESAFARLHRSPVIPLSLPHGWPRLLAAMTAADPAARPSAATTAAALHALGADQPVGALPPADPTVEVPRTQSVGVASGPRRGLRPRLVLVAAAAAVAAVVGATTLAPDPAVSREQPAPPTESGPAGERTDDRRTGVRRTPTAPTAPSSRTAVQRTGDREAVGKDAGGRSDDAGAEQAAQRTANGHGRGAPRHADRGGGRPGAGKGTASGRGGGPGKGARKGGGPGGRR